MLRNEGGIGAYLRDRVMEKVSAIAKGRNRRRPDEPDPSLPIGIQKVMTANYRALRSYVPQPYTGRITQFMTRGKPYRTALDPRLAWCDLAQGGVEIHTIHGDHETMLEEPNVGELASLLLACLQHSVGCGGR